MAYSIINKVSDRYVPKWGNSHEYIAIHYLGVDGQNYELAADGTGAHYTIYWDGTIYQRCSHDAIVWAVGTAGMYTQKHPYARNSNTISIELCCHCDGNKQSATDPKWYFTTATQRAAVWLVQKLMKELNIPIGNVLRHYDIVDKICPAPYVANNRYQTSWTWSEFLQKVGMSASGVPISKEDYINKVASIAMSLYTETRILPSVVIAQCCLENGYGLGADALVLTKVNNLLGMKADLTNTWQQWTVWDGKTITKRTPEYVGGKLIYKDDVFRVYKDYENCIRDYEMFLLHVRNDLGYKYHAVAGMTDPLAVITCISRGGYATDPAYITKVMDIINKDNLRKYDEQVGIGTNKWYRVAKDYKDGKYIGQTGAYAVKANAIADAKASGMNVYDPDGIKIYPEAHDHYAVQRRLSETKYRIGLFSILDNAKRMADDNWGYRVYDMDIRKIVYKPKLARWQKLCAACVRLNQWLLDDIKAGKDWRYYNTGHVSESTFWNTRKANKLYTNCMGGVGFAMKESGLPAAACSWYMAQGFIRWLNDHAEADLLKYANIIEIKNRTPKQLVEDGTLCPGDIYGFMTFNHTCIYLGNGLSYDTGHAFCKKGDSGEGAKFVQWIGPLSWPSYKVSYIIRLKG